MLIGPPCRCEQSHPGTVCPVYAGKWLIRRDSFCYDKTTPWTVWRWSNAIDQFVAWAATATHADAAEQVVRLSATYADAERDIDGDSQ